MPFVVIDFETTGLVPERSDRVIEVGLVLLDDNGAIESEWGTLVNPQRDMGASHIHGLRAADVFDAPTFGAIADQILRFTQGRTVVAHNATFDMRFLGLELTRAGYSIASPPPALCSMKWSGRFIGPAKLQHACEALGIPLTQAHSAQCDARATAELLQHLMRQGLRDKEWNQDVARSRGFAWPAPRRAHPVRTVPRSDQQTDARSWLHVVLGRAWIAGVPEDEAAYLLALDRTLLDRHISRSEGQQLVAVATQHSLSGATAARLHREYLHSMAQEALADGVLTDTERDDLGAVTQALGLTAADLANALAWAVDQRPSSQSASNCALAPGDRVVFTGETSKPRDDWVALIVAKGLCSGGISKSAKLVVAADPDSLSRKADVARRYGIPIIDERTFVRLFDQYVASLAIKSGQSPGR